MREFGVLEKMKKFRLRMNCSVLVDLDHLEKRTEETAAEPEVDLLRGEWEPAH
jgi:hypothetical protein